MKGVAVLFDHKFRRHGTVRFLQTANTLIVLVETDSSAKLKPGLHGFHIHESGDLTEGCITLCAHYNPDGTQHGGPRSKQRHRGDLGNVKALSDGSVKQTITTTRLTMKEILGRSVVIHENQDDLGRGGNIESLKTGNAGKRVLCGVIGRAAVC